MKCKTCNPTLVLTLLLVACGQSGNQDNITGDPPISIEKVSSLRPTVLPEALVSITPCSLDAVAEKPAGTINVVMGKSKLQLAGWAGNVADGSSSKYVWVQLAGPTTVYLKVRSGLKRPDVANFFKKPGLEDSGWEVIADVSPLAAGNYNVILAMFDGKVGLVCDTKRAIQLS